MQLLIPLLERARKINIWAAFIILSPYFGPLFAAFIITTQSWRIPFWVYVAETALCLALTILFVEETYYDRRLPAESQPERGSRLSRLVGISQWKSRHLRNTFGQAMMRPVKVLLKPTLLLSTIYYLLTFAWGTYSHLSLQSNYTPTKFKSLTLHNSRRNQHHTSHLPDASIQLRT